MFEGLNRSTSNHLSKIISLKITLVLENNVDLDEILHYVQSTCLGVSSIQSVKDIPFKNKAFKL